MNAAAHNPFPPAEPGPAGEEAHQSFRAMVMSEPYPCLVGKGLLRRGDYRFRSYGELGSPESARALAAELWQYIQDYPIRAEAFASFVASFAGPAGLSEAEFEHLMWQQLQSLHDLDREHHDWSPLVGTDPNTKGFSFSFAGRPFFIVGMHPGSSRLARRPERPTLVFNAHEQFDILRETGAITRMTTTIRARDRRLQGSENPALALFDGDHPETVMYSGRLPEEGWKCPVHIAPRAVTER
ncbi:hypothetical protein CFP65_0279 [Kitasatospora sp. MMS16-BH015]|uniref:guanitoxin biosynthesis heme-dependent pre-guanitoxin N-hydroxylase GntA n=1 Tax=Kitasatospora sp. MMS16-BH015 TaxID=2018025 RepID=UPI000CA38E55|nr:guanitoxin biosynthesis heme-dependent pre-guanitoxin N-hydroxylase GntA [Kitasatospora sp. MMS16-BH015]AUG75254.1 hypothetical protein CFP65_0279 [Kitasatospora sp. MMS16-BH015]